MQDAQYWLNEFWSGLSVLDLVGGSVLGTLLGLVLGIAGWRWLHRLVGCSGASAGITGCWPATWCCCRWPLPSSACSWA
nr:hypothetical protein [Stenotrophomonas maltophilia]